MTDGAGFLQRMRVAGPDSEQRPAAVFLSDHLTRVKR